MALQLKQKEAIVAELSESASTALSAVVADYHGLKVAEVTELRKQARESGVYLRVVRNTLAKRAVTGTEFECLDSALVGPTLLALSLEDPGAAARLLKEFAKSNEALEIRALAVGGQLLGPEQLDAVASLPTRDEALALLMGVLQAPITKLTRTLNDVPGRVVRSVAAVRDQKEAAGA